MRKRNRPEDVAHLSGFLYGISSFSGKLREYEAFSYLVKIETTNQSIEELINEYFRGQHVFSLSSVAELEGGLRDFEKRLREFLVRGQACVNSDSISGMRNYLSFRIMDMIDDIFKSVGKRLKVTVFEAHCNDVSLGEGTFFCIRRSDLLLVLQFNRYPRS